MGQFRIVGVACDAFTTWTDDGDAVHTYGDRAAGASCGEEFTLMGRATFADVISQAQSEDWKIVGTGRGRVYLCAAHASAVQA